jgi:hypothetical protein|tara:strand:+ start:3394 stop:3660 length:267 start_codon:yes stop_codon:yes gene_type:complete
VKYRITNAYCNLKEVGIVKMFMIEGLPFTFEEDGFDHLDPSIIAEANNNEPITLEMMYQWSVYLVLEGMHPIVYDLTEEIANPIDIPD